MMARNMYFLGVEDDLSLAAEAAMVQVPPVSLNLLYEFGPATCYSLLFVSEMTILSPW